MRPPLAVQDKDVPARGFVTASKRFSFSGLRSEWMLVICWPLALLALIAYPFVWLLLLPFRIIGIAVGGVLELVSAIIFLPVRMVRAI